MRFQRVIEEVYHRPWMITPEGHTAVHKVLQAHIVNPRAEMDFSGFINPRKEMQVTSDYGAPIAHVDVCGVLGSGLSPIEKSCGNTDYQQVQDEIEQAVQLGAKGIVFSFNTPGGATNGCLECAQAIANCPIPTVATVDGQCGSSGYFLASGCNRIFAPASSIVGCIGTIIPRVDSSGAWEMAGYKPDFITNTGGDLKSTGHGPSITDEQRAYLQELVDDSFSQFSGHVLDNREIHPSAMRGQMMVAPRAKDENLIDEIGSAEDAEKWLVSRIS